MNLGPLTHELALHQTRRQFFGRTAQGIGLAALGSLLNRDLFAAPETTTHGELPALHFAPKAKRTRSAGDAPPCVIMRSASVREAST